VAVFNDWIQEHQFPVQKLEAQLVPGMRIGAIATSYIAPEELYLSVLPTIKHVLYELLESLYSIELSLSNALLLLFFRHLAFVRLYLHRLLHLLHLLFYSPPSSISFSLYSRLSRHPQFQVPVQSCVMDRVSAQRSPPLAKLLEKARQAPDPDFFALLFHLLYEQQVRCFFSFAL